MDRPRSTTIRLAACLLIAVSLTACGEDGEGLLPTPTRTPSVTISPTRTPSIVPTRSPRPTETPSETPTEQPTETPTEHPTEQPTEQPTETPTEQPTETETVTETATPTPTEEPTESESPTESPTESPSASESADPDEEAAAEDDEPHPAAAWVWWILALLLLGAAIGIPLRLRSKRRRQWHTDLAACEAELAWLAHTLIPELRRNADSTDRVAGAWDVGGVGRATAAEDRLTALESTAPNDEGGVRARVLRDAVRGAQARLNAITSATTPDVVRATLDAAAADLDAVLTPVQP